MQSTLRFRLNLPSTSALVRHLVGLLTCYCNLHRAIVRTVLSGLALWLSVWCALFCTQSLYAQNRLLSSQPPLPALDLSVKKHNIPVELATTPAARQRGLMYRNTLDASQGMLFVFPQPGRQCFWMKNTPLKLDAAFIAADGHIVDILPLEPLDETPHCSTKAVGYVLEVHRGWFNKRRIKQGDRVQRLPPLSVAQ